MARKVCVSAVLCGVASLACPGLGSALDIDAKSFRCIRQMTPVRQFYVDNLQGNLDGTLAAANSRTGAVYPAGSVVQLIPGEAMVKRDKGFNAATHDWEFFVLDASKDAPTFANGEPSTSPIHSGPAWAVTPKPSRSGTSCAKTHTVALRSTRRAR
jgi:hypothetical protein